jgi:hypothetical protein
MRVATREQKMWDDIRSGLRSGIVFAAEMSVAVFAAAGADTPPIVPALAASLTLVAVQEQRNQLALREAAILNVRFGSNSTVRAMSA